MHTEWLILINRLCSKVAFKLNQVLETGDGPALFELLKCDVKVHVGSISLVWGCKNTLLMAIKQVLTHPQVGRPSVTILKT